MLLVALGPGLIDQSLDIRALGRSLGMCGKTNEQEGRRGAHA
ncbi:hypothetical protein SBA4_6110010 [Candidatus Sulfopaludibacter sp. SbA4]|nr:hypothetical protein SBA4_6110010 [Candidatus Sulfopaludibacter sp. SbA4]